MSSNIQLVTPHNIFGLFWLGKPSKKTVMEQLDLNLPKVSQNIENLMANGLVIEATWFEGAGGREAKLI